jgi:hypothetical protein
VCTVSRPCSDFACYMLECFGSTRWSVDSPTLRLVFPCRYWPDRVGETNHYESTEQGHAVSVTCTQERVFESWVERTLRVDQELPQRSSLVVQQ